MRIENKIVFPFVIGSLLWTMIGCDAFVRKFTRKPKKDKLPQEELVLSPVEYNLDVNKADLYQQYFLYWKSWQEELSDSLLRNANQKKHIECINEAIKNLERARDLLRKEDRGKLTGYIEELVNLKGSIESDVYCIKAELNRAASDRIKRNIIRDFSYRKMKDRLI